ncbi:coiled-coil domain-containing protein 171 [Nematolebias whitei]|uniref:coiled-coil domain-containing protein 171 n=1 Tax=Nematolebias whitei TaxID=451745 RepID=UPI0018983F0C|nr:coiled-coil domain-containing protein 171 [Nematolebias whitei]
MSQKQKGGADRKQEEKPGGGRSRGDPGRRAAAEGGEESRRLRWRINQLEKEKLKLRSSYNQEVCHLQAELTRLRASVEQGEAQRAELQYQLTASRRDGERVVELSRDRRTLTEQTAELQQTICELQKALRVTRQAREEDQHALQQEVEERTRLMESFCSENQHLHRLLQNQEEALEEVERRAAEVQEENRRRAKELELLLEEKERRRREKELVDQNLEEERDAHLETKRSLELLQLRGRDLEAERSDRQEAQVSLELLRAHLREMDRAYGLERERSGSALQRLQEDFAQRQADMTVALETERKATSDLSERLEEEKRGHAHTHALLQQAAERQSDSEEVFLNLVNQIRQTLQQHRSTGEQLAQPAKHDGKQSPAEVLQLLTMTLNSYQNRLEDSTQQVQDQLLAAEKLQEENRLLQQLISHQKRQVELCHSQSDSHRERASSLERRCSSLTSDLARLQGLLSRSCQESSSFFSACGLLCGALKHAHRCLSALCEQKRLLSRQLKEKELLEEEVRRLAEAFRGEEEEEGRGRRALRRWRRSVCAVLAMRRWCSLSRRTTVLFHVDRGGGRICVCGDSSTATQKGQADPQTDEAAEGVCARWLRSERLSSIILSSMCDLQGALANTGSSSPVISAAQSGLSRLLDHLLDQSAYSISSDSAEEDFLRRLTPRQLDSKTLVSALQQHFLLFSQRLHSAEVERRSLRLEVANLQRALRREKDQTVPSERFHSVCEELRQALTREQEVQMLMKEQSKQLHTLQDRVDNKSSEETETQHTLTHTTQALLDTRKEVSRKERSLRILGKHLSEVQKERRQQEEQLQRAEEELRDAARPCQS